MIWHLEIHLPDRVYRLLNKARSRTRATCSRLTSPWSIPPTLFRGPATTHRHRTRGKANTFPPMGLLCHKPGPFPPFVSWPHFGEHQDKRDYVANLLKCQPSRQHG